MNNYRPIIMILTCFCKIFEKNLYARLYKFLKKHNVIYKNHYGFQSSTVDPGCLSPYVTIILMNPVKQLCRLSI